MVGYSLQIFSVGQVTRYLKGVLASDEALCDLWVAGELSNVSPSPAGHVFFTLKDRECQLRCVMFRRSGRAFPAGNGEAVIAHGYVSLYEVSGALQFYVDAVQPEGLGLLHLQFEQLRAKLEEEGLFDAARKRPLPLFPKRIGVVTSPTGAVLRDIMNVVGRRYPLAELVLVPTSVQGDEAVDGITGAFETLNSLPDIDVVIVARGGGSLEELQAFNDEQVARAIFASRAPVISGVGHETDYTIADYVADLRAPTPSAAAELAVPDRLDLRQQLEARQRSLASCLADSLAGSKDDMNSLLVRLQRCGPDVATRRLRIDDFARRVTTTVDTHLALGRERLRSRILQLNSLSPLLTLSRGYAVVQHKGGGPIVRSVAEVALGDELDVRVKDGSFGVIVSQQR